MKAILLLIPAFLLFGCCGICLGPMLGMCPQYAPPPQWYYEKCIEMGGNMATETNPASCCTGPPFCVVNGTAVDVPTPTATPTPVYTPTPTPLDNETAAARCTGSGGTWLGGESWFACDCGDEMIYNTATYGCERCPEGQLVGRGLGPAFCYTPTGHNGEPCDRSTDCGGGSCVLVNQYAVWGKGECHDLPFGCFVRIDEDGNYNPDAMLCVD